MLVVGLGNPGRQYVMTRHNIGFMVLEEATKGNGQWVLQTRFEARVAKGVVGGKGCTFMQPLTYMNDSGRAVAKYLRYHNMGPQDLLVVVDDAALPFGTLRYRSKGSSGGHNGLKSIEDALQTQEYARLRFGIGAPTTPLMEYVLGEFTPYEKQQLPQYITDAVEQLDRLIYRS